MFTTLTIQLNNIWAEDCIILRPIARVCRKSALYYNKYSLGQILPLIYTTKSSYSGNIKRWHIIYFSLFMYYKIIISHGVTCKVNSTWPLQMKTTTDWVYIISFFFRFADLANLGCIYYEACSNRKTTHFWKIYLWQIDPVTEYRPGPRHG